MANINEGSNRFNKEQWLSYIESLHASVIDLGLDRVLQVAEKLVCFKPAKTVVVIAGTNGKGTTTAILTSLLSKVKKTKHTQNACSEYLTSAHYNSPHILDYNERVSIQRNGHVRNITDVELIQSFQAVEQARENIPLTYFEFGTLAALWQILQWDVDIALLEIGLGGRLDAVNIVDSDVSVITSIGLDHQDWLGNTLDEIGSEKAGVARKNCPVICGQSLPSSGFLSKVKEIKGELIQYTSDSSCLDKNNSLDTYYFEQISKDNMCLSYMKKNKSRCVIELPIPNIPAVNIASAIQTLAIMDMLPSEIEIKESVKNTQVLGRMTRYLCQYNNKNFTLILDVAHNAQAAQYLADQTLNDADVAICGMLKDKNIVEVVNCMQHINKWYFTELKSERSYTLDEIIKSIDQRVDDAHYMTSIAESLSEAVEHCMNDATILVFGSFYVIEETLLYLKRDIFSHVQL
jgi:dihydrofolate synthase/folylpolyglutamate synthase